MATAKKGTSVKAGSGKIKDKGTVVVNLSGVEARKRKAVRLPEGNYRAKVVKAETFTSKQDNPGVRWVFEIVEGEGKGARFYHNTMLVEQSIWAFRGVLQALTPAVKIKDSAMQIPLDKLVNRTCAIELVDGEYENKLRSEINDVFHESLLEDEAEEEEEEYEEDEDEDEYEEEEDESEDDEEEEDEDDEEDEEIDLDEDDL